MSLKKNVSFQINNIIIYGESVCIVFNEISSYIQYIYILFIYIF